MRFPTAARRPLALVVAVVFALAVAGWQARLHWSNWNPTPVATIGVGETARVGGTDVTLVSLEAQERLPALDPDQEWVVAPAGTRLVQVVLTVQVVDPEVDPAEHFCDLVAVDAAGREWTQDSAIGSLVEGPTAVGCSIPEGSPTPPDGRHAVGQVFVVPADVADELVVDITLTSYDLTARLTR